jgi:hypothetical protein
MFEAVIPSSVSAHLVLLITLMVMLCKVADAPEAAIFILLKVQVYKAGRLHQSLKFTIRCFSIA